jgi:splicing factor 3A subunit 3
MVEQLRASHEDIELFERAIVEIMIDDPKSAKDNALHSHAAKHIRDRIIERGKTLIELYEDKDGAQQNEIKSILGKGQALYSIFYSKLEDIQKYHDANPDLKLERSEAEHILKTIDVDKLVMFSGEEGYGRNLDLHSHYELFVNLEGAPRGIDYVAYLDSFYTFTEKFIVKNKNYHNYLKGIIEYMLDFLSRSQPLTNFTEPLRQIDTDFEDSFAAGQFVPLGWQEGDEEVQKESLFCKECNRLFNNPTVFNHHFNGKKHKSAVARYMKTMKPIWYLENKINRVADLLLDTIEDTKASIEKKQGRNVYEMEIEVEPDVDVSSDTSSEEEVRMTKANYPIGWDGNPIPYWLYKLHGLGVEFKCEICGNTSYWGKRAYDKHFQEWRHAHGMKCLRLENTKEFHDITKIKDALELGRHLRGLEGKGEWDADMMEEFEDDTGNVLNRKMYLDLKKQGMV